MRYLVDAEILRGVCIGFHICRIKHTVFKTNPCVRILIDLFAVPLQVCIFYQKRINCIDCPAFDELRQQIPLYNPLYCSSVVICLIRSRLVQIREAVHNKEVIIFLDMLCNLIIKWCSRPSALIQNMKCIQICVSFSLLVVHLRHFNKSLYSIFDDLPCIIGSVLWQIFKYFPCLQKTKSICFEKINKCLIITFVTCCYEHMIFYFSACK